MNAVFLNRQEAGNKLAQKLAYYQNDLPPRREEIS